MKKFVSALVIGSTALLAGCATVTGNGEQTVVFDTKQEGLVLYNYNGKKQLCNLPCSRQMDGNDFRSFVIRGDGYKTKGVTLDISRNKATYANLISIANLTDSFTGADTNLQSYVFIELEKLDGDNTHE